MWMPFWTYHGYFQVVVPFGNTRLLRWNLLPSLSFAWTMRRSASVRARCMAKCMAKWWKFLWFLGSKKKNFFFRRKIWRNLESSHHLSNTKILWLVTSPRLLHQERCPFDWQVWEKLGPQPEFSFFVFSIILSTFHFRNLFPQDMIIWFVSSWVFWD